MSRPCFSPRGYSRHRMSITAFRDKDFKGTFARLGPGKYSGSDLNGCAHGGSGCEDLNNEISSVRVDAGTIAVLADGYSVSASGSGSRVLVGPAEVADMSAIGLDDRVSSIHVIAFTAATTARQTAAATIYDGYGATGRRSDLFCGDYAGDRLTSEEVKLPGDRIVSLAVEPNTVAVLYTGDKFESGLDAVAVVGPVIVSDLGSLSLSGRVRSIRVLCGEPARQWRSHVPLGSTLRARPQLQPQPQQPTMPQQPPSPQPTVVVVQQKRGVDAKMFALIALFIIVVAFAAFMSGHVAKSPAEKGAAEANILGQMAIPMAVIAAA